MGNQLNALVKSQFYYYRKEVKSQMEGQTITIPMEQYEELMDCRAAIHALQCYVNAEKYPNRKVMCDIVGIPYKGED